MAGTMEISQVGKREDLLDIITNVDAKACPLMSMIPKGAKPGNTKAQFQMDKFADVSTDGIVDGEDVSSSNYENAAQYRKLAEMYVQKVRRVPMVSDMSENVSDIAGLRKKEFAGAIAKKTIELKRDHEAVLGSDNECQADNGTVAYKTRGLGKWIQNSAQSVLEVDSSFRTPTGSLNNTAVGSLTESNVQDVLQSIYEQTGEHKRMSLVCGAALKRRFTTFTVYHPDVDSHTLVRSVNMDASTKTIHATVDFFNGDFGELELIPSTFLASGTSDAPTRRGYVIDPKLLELRFVRRPGFKQLPDLGGGPRGIVDSIFQLLCFNPLAFGKFYATS